MKKISWVTKLLYIIDKVLIYFLYRLNISDKLDIISDTDVDNDEDSSSKGDSPATADGAESEANNKKPNKQNTPEKVNSSDLKNVTMAMPQYNNEAIPANDKSKTPAKLPKPSFRILNDYDKETPDAPERTTSYYRYIERPSDDLEDEVCFILFCIVFSTAMCMIFPLKNAHFDNCTVFPCQILIACAIMQHDCTFGGSPVHTSGAKSKYQSR